MAALGLTAFVLGTAELLVVGVLDLVGRDFAVSVASSGRLVTAYALGVSIGGPLLAGATIRAPRKALLATALCLYAAFSLVAVMAQSFDLLLATRAATGAVHGLVIGVAFVVAADLVGPDKQGRALSAVTGGLTVSMVVGVPLGTLIGNAIEWRAAFAAVVILGFAACLAVVIAIPDLPSRRASKLGEQARTALAPRVVLTLAVTLFVMGGQFTAFTYLVPFLREVTGVASGAVSLFLLLFGAAAVAGTLMGGRGSDRGAARVLVVGNTLLLLPLGALYLSAHSALAVAAVVVAWGLVGFAIVPALQLRVITLAGPGADLAATLGASAANVGIACGALLGGLVASGSVRAVPLAALAVCGAVLPLTVLSARRGLASDGLGATPATADATAAAGGDGGLW